MSRRKPEFTSTISPEEQAEYDRLEAAWQAAHEAEEKAREVERVASGRYFELSDAYRKNPEPSPEMGAELLAALAAYGVADRAHRPLYTAANEAAKAINDFRKKLLLDKKMHPTSRNPFGKPGPVEVAYLHGWTDGRPFGEETTGGICIGWSKSGTGFGVLTLVQQDDGTFTADTECMGDEFVREVLEAFIKQVKVRE